MATARTNARIEIHDQLQARAGEFANALPSHIKPEYFQRATLTALSQNQKLVEVDRRSLWNALMRCAQDGLIPDGREAVLVIYKDRERGSVAQYQPMVAGVRKLVLQSGEITRFEQAVICDLDTWEYELGDTPFIKHKPSLGNRGRPILAYSVAQFRDGTLSRDVMTVDEIEKRRNVSRAKDSGFWVDWWNEMACKTVAKHHAKMLPMSVEARQALTRDDDDNSQIMPVLAPTPAPEKRPRLVEQFDALSASTDDGETAKQRRGRPRKTDDTPDQATDELAQLTQGDEGPVQIDIEETINQQQTIPLDDGWPGPDVSAPAQPNKDYAQGAKDARAGLTGCLNAEIKNNPLRFREWQRGYNTAKAT